MESTYFSVFIADKILIATFTFFSLSNQIPPAMQIEVTTPMPQPINLEDSDWSADALLDIPRRDLSLLFILSVVLPLSLALVIFVLLSVVMFGRREGL